jgi:fructose-bisphosphate aldolase class I
VFHALYRHRVQLEYMVLKPSMVLPGKESAAKAGAEVVARETLAVLPPHRSRGGADDQLPVGRPERGRCDRVPQRDEPHGGGPWVLSFSYARALQDDAMKTWAAAPITSARRRQAFHRRARMNSLARAGKWTQEMEKA